MSQSYIGSSSMPIGQTLLAEFLKKNVTIPPPPPSTSFSTNKAARMVEEIDLTKDDRKKRDTRQLSEHAVNHQAINERSRLTSQRPTFPDNKFLPLPVAPPLSMSQDKPTPAVINLKSQGNSLRKPDAKVPWKPPSPSKVLLGQPPLPSAPAVIMPNRGKSLMSLPLPQPVNDGNDLISYSPTSPITPPQPKMNKKGIMDLPLPPGKTKIL